MALQRIEIRLSPLDSDEAAVIEAVEALGQYGAKGRFFKERLIKGLAVVMREVASIQAEADPLTVLDRLASSVNAGHYHVLKALLKPQHSTPPVQGAAEHTKPQNAHTDERLPPAPLSASDAAESASGVDLSPALGVAVICEEETRTVELPTVDRVVPGTSVDVDQDSSNNTSPVEVDPPKVKTNWAQFQAAAGVRGKD